MENFSSYLLMGIISFFKVFFISFDLDFNGFKIKMSETICQKLKSNTYFDYRND